MKGQKGSVSQKVIVLDGSSEARARTKSLCLGHLVLELKKKLFFISGPAFTPPPS